MGQIVVYYKLVDRLGNLDNSLDYTDNDPADPIPIIFPQAGPRRFGMRDIGDAIEKSNENRKFKLAVLTALQKFIDDDDYEVRFEAKYKTKEVPGAKSYSFRMEPDDIYSYYLVSPKDNIKSGKTLILNFRRDRDGAVDGKFQMNITAPRRSRKQKPFVYLKTVAEDIVLLTDNDERADYLLSTLSFQRCL